MNSSLLNIRSSFPDEIRSLGDGLSQNADPLPQPNYYIDHLSRYNDEEICSSQWHAKGNSLMKVLMQVNELDCIW